MCNERWQESWTVQLRLRQQKQVQHRRTYQRKPFQQQQAERQAVQMYELPATPAPVPVRQKTERTAVQSRLGRQILSRRKLQQANGAIKCIAPHGIRCLVIGPYICYSRPMTQTIPAWLDTKEYPFAPHLFACVDGNIHYIDVGNGDPVVFLHGSPDWSFSYRGIIQAVSKHYRCIAVDHLGFGLSDKPIHADYSPRAHANRLEQLLTSLKLTNITLVMHDWGGPIGMSYAVQHPENIKALVIINSWTWPVNKDRYYQAFSGFMGGALGRFFIRQWNIFIRFVVPTSYGVKAKLTPAVRTHLLMPFSSKETRIGMEIFPGAIIGETPWLTQIWEKRSELANKPLLIIWGLKDIAVREKELEQWKKAFPGAQVHTFADAGHFPHEEYPDKTAQVLLTFLQQQ